MEKRVDVSIHFAVDLYGDVQPIIDKLRAVIDDFDVYDPAIGQVIVNGKIHPKETKDYL